MQTSGSGTCIYTYMYTFAYYVLNTITFLYKLQSEWILNLFLSCQSISNLAFFVMNFMNLGWKETFFD